MSDVICSNCNKYCEIVEIKDSDSIVIEVSDCCEAYYVDGD